MILPVFAWLKTASRISRVQTVDLDEDWDHALAIYEALGPEWLDWQRIARLLDHQPALRSRMAALNRVHQCPVRVGEG